MNPSVFRVAAAALLCAGSLSAAVVTTEKNGAGWRLLVDGQPFVVKGVAYGPEKVGEDPSLSNLRTWMYVDENRNGRLDGPYDAFVDVNGDDAQSTAEPAIGDWALLRDLGANTIRLYHHPSNDASVQAGYAGNASLLLQYNHAPEKAALRDLYNRYGIRVAVGDFFGAYRIGSGVSSSTNTVYSNATQRTRMLASVQQMVTDFKDEDFLLMYVLGNENNLTSLTFTDANADPESFAEAIGEAVALIKSQDPDHPVAICLGDVPSAVIAKLAALPVGQQPDILGTNVYRDPDFTTVYSSVTATGWDKPVLFTEYGDNSASFTGSELNETQQSSVLASAWNDILANVAPSGSDSAIGGIAFAWLDNWWQSGSPSAHTINTPAATDFENEWHGFASQGNGARSPFLRRLRTVYATYQGLWGTNVRTLPADGGRFLQPFGSGSFVMVDIPAGAFAAGTTITISTTTSFPAGAGNTQDFTATGVGIEITAAGGVQPSKNLDIYLPFSHAGGAYVIARYDTDRGVWVTLRTRRDASGALVATTDHLSLFQVMQVSPSASTQNVVAYPNPVRPALGHAGLTFSQLPPASQVRLFTSAGEFVREIYADNTGIAFWNLLNRDGEATASGVYFVLIEGPGGDKSLKVAVQR